MRWLLLLLLLDRHALLSLSLALRLVCSVLRIDLASLNMSVCTYGSNLQVVIEA